MADTASKICPVCDRHFSRSDVPDPSKFKNYKFCGRKCSAKGRLGTVEQRMSRNAQRIASGCILWTGGKRHHDGYGIISVNNRPCQAHRVAWEIASGKKVPPNKQVLHTCDVPGCINPLHLYVGTPADNMADKVARNRATRGEDVNTSKLTERDVRLIRLSSPSERRLLAEKFGVSPQTIWRVRTKRHWKHLI